MPFICDCFYIKKDLVLLSNSSLELLWWMDCPNANNLGLTVVTLEN